MKRTSLDLEQHIFHSPNFRSVITEAVKFFRSTPPVDLPPGEKFIGGGVYALYYKGTFKYYKPLAKQNAKEFVQPIYVGKAVPPGWRTGRISNSESMDLFRRLSEHAKSIMQAQNLNLVDFRCRFVILNEAEGDLIVPLEAELIRVYSPIWNQVVDGFGNHDPGSGRYDQATSEWDILHPGRTWTKNLRGVAPVLKNIVANVKAALVK
ncbi:MAG: Eco29kI family restriction endonuclease [Bacteroidota bacterium]